MTKNIMESDVFSPFLQLFFFENRLKDELADYAVISGKYLFRRDSTRLVAYEMPDSEERTFHYPIVSLETEGYDGVQFKDRQNLSFKKGEKEDVLEPVEVSYGVGSMQLLATTEFDFEVKVEAKSVVRALLAIQRKVLNQDIDLEKAVIGFDFSNNKLTVDLPEERFEALVKGNFEEVPEKTVVYYSYLLFKDFLQNANSFSKEVAISVKAPLFTVIQYTDLVKGVLAHKMIKSEID